MNNGIWNKERGPYGETGDTGATGPQGPVFDGSTPLDELTVNGVSIFDGNITQTAGVTSLLNTTITGSTAQIIVKNLSAPLNEKRWDIFATSGGHLRFRDSDDDGTPKKDVLVLTKANNVLINTTTDNGSDSLQVGGSTTIAGNVTQTSGVTSLKATTINGLLDIRGGAGALFLTDEGESNNYSIISSSGLLTFRIASGATLWTINSAGDLYSGAVDNGTDLLQVGSNTDISASIGRGKMGYIGSDSDTFYLSHYDRFNATEYNLRFLASGSTVVNAKTGRAVSITNESIAVATFSETAISLLKPVTISSGSSDTIIALKNDTTSSYPLFLKSLINRQFSFHTDSGFDHKFSFTNIGSGTFDVEIDGALTVKGLPTSNPNVAGALWNSSGTVMISAG